MFGYSMTRLVRTHMHKLDRPLREKILHLYQPFKRIPCFMHSLFEEWLKRKRQLSVVVEFKDGCYHAGYTTLNKVIAPCKRSKVKQHFSRISCCSMDVTPNRLEEVLLSCHHIHKIYLNREVKALLDVAVPSIKGKNVIGNNSKLTGKGTTVAIIDTGIYPHKDLSGRITHFVDFVNHRTDPYDDNGHGGRDSSKSASRHTYI